MVTAQQIFDANMLAKCNTYTLAYELALEEQHGGDIDCCFMTLMKLWGYTTALNCAKAVITEEVQADGEIVVLESVEIGTVKIFVDGVSISGQIPAPASVGGLTALIIEYINAYQTTYVAVEGPGLNHIHITGGCKDAIITIDEGSCDVNVVSEITGGVCVWEESSNCLIDKTVKDLIGKVNVMCNN